MFELHTLFLDDIKKTTYNQHGSSRIELKTGQFENPQNKKMYIKSGNDFTKLKKLHNLLIARTYISTLKIINYVK